MNNIRTVLVFELLSKKIDNDAIIFFEGQATKNGLKIKDYIGITREDIENQSIDGQWFAVIQKNNEIKVITDFFGFATIFYARIDSKLIVSSNYDAIISYFKKNKINLELDYAEIYPYFASNHSLFNQAYSQNTSCKTIKRLLPNQFISINNSKYLIKEHENLNHNLDYESLIKNGVEKSLINLENLEKMGFKNFKQSLSGGKDSRCVLALALNGISAEKLTIITRPNSELSNKKPNKVIDDDFEIALDIVSSLNLKWNEPTLNLCHPISFKDSQDDYRFFRSSNYFNYNFTRFKTTLPKSESFIELAGGCGEVLRGFWGEYFKNINIGTTLEKNKFDLTKSADIVFNTIVKKNKSLNNLYEESKQKFTEAISNSNDIDFFEAMDTHYFNHRNRYHFGNHNESNRLGSLLYYPLAMKEFVMASKLLNQDQRSSGKLVFDIISCIDPQLHAFGYETDFNLIYNIKRIERKNINSLKKKKEEFIETLKDKKEFSKKIYDQPSYNMDIEINITFQKMLKTCKNDLIIKTIIDAFNYEENFKNSTRAQKAKLLNKLDIVYLVLSQENINFQTFSIQ